MDQSGAARVDAAYEALAGVAVRTPLQRSDRHSAAIGGRVWLKREDLQAVRSYKLRGAYFLIASLSPEDAARGVVCASAGNHAQGVAYACAQARGQGADLRARHHAAAEAQPDPRARR